MKKNIPWRVLAVLCAMIFAGNASAEEAAQGSDLLDGIKSQMITAAQENNRLVEENETLRARLIGLQLEIEQYEQDVEAIDPGYRETREVSRELASDPMGYRDPEGDALIKEAQNIYLSGQMMDTDETQKLRELQLYDLQYEMQELQLDLKSAEFFSEKVKKEQNPELESLQQDIKINEAKISELLVKIAEQEKAAMANPQKIELLEMENAALKVKIKKLKKLLK